MCTYNFIIIVVEGMLATHTAPYLLRHRGETFHKAFLELGEVRSIIPDSVRMLALTATATKATRIAVCRTLGMIRPAACVGSA